MIFDGRFTWCTFHLGFYVGWGLAIVENSCSYLIVYAACVVGAFCLEVIWGLACKRWDALEV